MPKFLEKKLKKQYSDDIPYRIMNSLGYMRGSKETEKGARARVRRALTAARGQERHSCGRRAGQSTQQ